MNNLGKLHCGACMIDFDSTESLFEHLKTCCAARYMLPLIYQEWSGNDDIGHPLSRFLFLLHRSTDIIKQYISTIVNEYSSSYRAKIHYKLCEALELDYRYFKPFESTGIRHIPTASEAEEILWIALFEHGQSLIKETKNDN